MRPLLRALTLVCLLASIALPAAAADAPADSSAAGGWLGLFRAISNPLGDDAVRVEPGWRASTDLRVRQELLNNVFYFTPEQPDRNWIRVRTRAGLRYGWGNAHEVEGRLCSEFRKIRVPDTKLNYDEIILDRLLYRYRAWPSIAITLGRQDIRWDDGFLVMDGTPLDGSRSSYMNALRFQIGEEGPEPGLTELFVAYNPATDDLVLWDDDVERHLTDADEAAVAFRTRPWANQQLALIWKRERDPDHLRPALDAWTLDYRGERQRGDIGVAGEFALQLQDWTGAGVDEQGLAWAMQFRLRRTFLNDRHLDLGIFGYSGRSDQTLAFRTPWGRWPKWSELMLYRLIGESGVGLWANMGGAWAEVQKASGGQLMALGLQSLFALSPSAGYRDLLVRARLELPLFEGLGVQFLLESPLFNRPRQLFAIPAYGTSTARPIDSGDDYFVRWQLSYALP